MKLKLSLLVLLCFVSQHVWAQWEKTADYNVGATGKIAAHGSTVFLYGYQGQQFVYRTTDNGTSWADIADKFPDKVYEIHSHGSELFAIVGINNIYSSVDDGVTWTSKSNIALANGAVMSLVSNGSALYAVTNRNSVFKSNDSGSTWTQIDINYSSAQVLGFDFAAVGNKMVFCAVNLGSFISADGGANWSLINPSIIIGSVHAFNNEIYGSTYGMYKLVSDTSWAKIQSGFPSGIGLSGSTKGTISLGNKLFTYYSDVVSLSSKIFTSEDNGNNWSEVGNDLPSATTTSLNDFIDATPQYLYCYIYSIFSAGATGVYRYPLSITSVENEGNEIPLEFSLSQNYPNPFNPSTTISYKLLAASHVSLKVYDILGKEVVTLIDEELPGGNYYYTWDASGIASGVYLYRLIADNYSATRKLVLMK
ncbi:MAG: T9SS type A sorting domain-containing protein [Bacteroidota bacterium]